MENRLEEDIEFISTELLPEAVHNRCFCEPGSREFVAFVSAVVEPARSARIENDHTEHYRATLIVNFSGEPRAFELSIKTLRPSDDDATAYDGFLNEEMFYSNIAKRYDLGIYPKCYVADMGRYGRPVIVLEDLEALGYRGLDSKLDEDHLDLSLRAIGRFHERGFRLKATNFNSFREFYAKLIDTRLDGRLSSEDLGSEATKRVLDVLRKLGYPGATEIEHEENEVLRTICHGNMNSKRRLFFRYDNGKPVDVKIVGWNGLRYCSIAVDLADILHDNLSDECEAKKYLSVYLEAGK